MISPFRARRVLSPGRTPSVSQLATTMRQASTSRIRSRGFLPLTEENRRTCTAFPEAPLGEDVAVTGDPLLGIYLDDLEPVRVASERGPTSTTPLTTSFCVVRVLFRTEEVDSPA